MKKELEEYMLQIIEEIKKDRTKTEPLMKEFSKRLGQDETATEAEKNLYLMGLISGGYIVVDAFALTNTDQYEEKGR